MHVSLTALSKGCYLDSRVWT